MFTVDEVIGAHYPSLQQKRLYSRLGKPLLKKLLCERAFTEFAETYPHLHGIEFIEQAMEYFDFSYSISDRDRENIPPAGRVVIIANHPVGSLDGLALYKLVHEIRPDVRIVANDLLGVIPPLRDCLLPVGVMTGTNSRQQVKKIIETLEKEQAVIIFPAGEVSRMSFQGIRDCRWHSGFLRLAEQTRSPVLPVHISGRNSTLFYSVSAIAKPLSTLLLVQEMFRQKSKSLHFQVGQLIPHSSYNSVALPRSEKVNLLKRHLYRIGRGKKPLFVTESAIAAPEKKVSLKAALEHGQKLGTTPDGKQIILFTPQGSSPLMREIGRLREITFRSVGEGTGRRRDLDRFDSYYSHLVLWDENELEIVGAYRFVDSAPIIKDKGIGALYSGSLFSLDQEVLPFLENGMELGRSFVQQKYWNKRSLDYLWFGIGAFLRHRPEIRYLFGPVSISNSLPPLARDLLVCFYRLYFSPTTQTPCSKRPFNYSYPIQELEKQFSGEDYNKDFKVLKSMLSNMGVAVPTLYKQYTELCKPGGVLFLDFNVDPDFNDCIDGLVVVDLTRLKEKKRKRYMGETRLKTDGSVAIR